MPATDATNANAPGARKRSKVPRASLSPEDWVSASMALLLDNGIDAVRVDVLARKLKVTRGSFYWHFADREALLRHLLTAWRDNATARVIARFEAKSAEPRALIGELLSLPFRGRVAAEASSVELAIRGWARRDEMARRFVDEVDAQRLAYIESCFSALGLSISEASARAFALYSYELAESLLGHQGTPSQKHERRRFMEHILLPTGGG